MKRRELLIGAGVLAASAGVTSAQKKTVAVAKSSSGYDAALVDAAADCVKKGRVCLAQCVHMLADGDTSMAGCSRSVTDMVAVSEALLTLASVGSRHIKAMAQATAEVVRDCEAECRKHQEMHEVCRACAESCARLGKESIRVSV